MVPTVRAFYQGQGLWPTFSRSSMTKKMFYNIEARCRSQNLICSFRFLIRIMKIFDLSNVFKIGYQSKLKLRLFNYVEIISY